MRENAKTQNSNSSVFGFSRMNHEKFAEQILLSIARPCGEATFGTPKI